MRYSENYGAVHGAGVKVGSVIGYVSQTANGGKADIAYCANHGAITSTKGRMGGIIGWVYSLTATDSRVASVSFCINKGSVTPAISYESGGVIGYNVGVNMDNCVNLGTLALNGSTESKAPMGGVVGKTYPKTSLVYSISNCYTTVGDVIPSVGYEKPAQFIFTDCGTTTLEAITAKNTTLTFGDGGYTTEGDSIILECFKKVILGDANSDGKIDISDAIAIIVDFSLGKGYAESSDINGDAVVNIIDILFIIGRLIN